MLIYAQLLSLSKDAHLKLKTYKSNNIVLSDKNDASLPEQQHIASKRIVGKGRQSLETPVRDGNPTRLLTSDFKMSYSPLRNLLRICHSISN